jgi:hypothetical protein
MIKYRGWLVFFSDSYVSFSRRIASTCPLNPRGIVYDSAERGEVSSRSGPVQNLVAFPAKRDQVGLGIVTKGAAQYHVVNFKSL